MHALYFDGGSRNNPGPSGAGAVLYALDEGGGSDDDGAPTIVWERWQYIDHATNNEAEYAALILGLTTLQEEEAEDGRRGVQDLEIRGDSKLVLNQVLGVFRTRQQNLQSLCRHARALLDRMDVPPASLVHVERKKNAHADRLANRAMDTRRGGFTRHHARHHARASSSALVLPQRIWSAK